MVINNNISALFNLNYGRQIKRDTSLSLEKISTGSRINRASDDASGMVRANQLRAQYEGLQQGIKNANDGIGIAKIADGALDEYGKLLVEARKKALDAASDNNSAESRATLEGDVKKLLAQADSIATTTSFNGINLLDGSFSAKKFQVGAYSGQTIDVSIGDAKIATLGLADADVDLTTQAGASTAVTDIDAAIDSLDAIRASIGSSQLQFESTVRNQENTATNVKAAESQIRDTDYGAEQEILNKLSIRAQANAFALSKSFENQSLVLNLLR